ncbi:MAG TPA: DNA ligase [Acidobacteria bacterium]|nr:DNA ligase [Acidobacteriota bacterium]
MSEFFRFPHTPHLAWLGAGSPRNDKVLTPAEAEELLAGEVVVEEKVDGANIGFSTTESGELRVQNRGSYLGRSPVHPQFRPLWSWLPAREEELANALWPNLMLFGEWCYAIHSVSYGRLPDWFLGFDIYDRETSTFWATARRDALLASLQLHPVPHLARGHFSTPDLSRILAGPSRLGGDMMEGVVVRQEAGSCTTARAKLVRAEFAQAIEEHWSRGVLRRNRLAEESVLLRA